MKKVNTKTKVIALSTAAVMTTAIYLKSDNNVLDAFAFPQGYQ